MTERARTYLGLIEACRYLNNYGQHTCNYTRRFSIGFYQIAQAMQWANTASAAESWAAAAIHLLAATEGADKECAPEQHLPLLIANTICGPLDYKEVLYDLSIMQRQLIYKSNADSIKRKSRYSSGVLSSATAYVVTAMFSQIVNNRRASAIEEAFEIMGGKL